MKQPGPDHPISVTPNRNRIRVFLGGEVVADTVEALTLAEASYPLVHYIPRKDAAMQFLERTDHVTHCPYKGDAHYFSIKAGPKLSENAVWTYEQPFPAVAGIEGYLAFYTDRVDRIEETPVASA
jgi:uncharacterized protein (DUF427 family)